MYKCCFLICLMLHSCYLLESYPTQEEAIQKINVTFSCSESLFFSIPQVTGRVTNNGTRTVRDIVLLAEGIDSYGTTVRDEIKLNVGILPGSTIEFREKVHTKDCSSIKISVKEVSF